MSKKSPFKYRFVEKTIVVDQKKISTGEKNEPGSCPVALACSAAGLEEVLVNGDEVEFTSPSQKDEMGDPVRLTASLPVEVSQFIGRFDNAEEVAPIKFKLKVADGRALVKKTIKVTKSSIAKGEPGVPDSCAIARACKSLGFKNVSVDGDSMEFEYGGEYIEIGTPEKASTFIETFDEDKSKVKPFSFQITF